MGRIWLPIALLTVFLGIGVALGGVRILVMQPTAGLRGNTLIVARAEHTSFLDSPQRICPDKLTTTRDFCAADVLAGITTYGLLLARLPYSETLYKMTGAP